MPHRWLALLVTGIALSLAQPQAGKLVTIPVVEDGVPFLALGDIGTGDRPAGEIAAEAAKAYEVFPFKFAVLLGDNMYGSEKPKDFERKFEAVYRRLLDAGVKFYATLGNHDDPVQTHYKFFNMDGRRYYTFKPKDGVRFFMLDSNYMDKPQIEWLENALAASKSEWKIVCLHHPLYSSGEKHGPSLQLRAILEPIFVKHGVDVVLAGHEHFYERIDPQRGIYYFIMGSSGKLRRGNIGRSEITAKGFDKDRAFLLMQVAGDQLYFQAISRTGETVDSGVLPRLERAKVVSQRGAE